MVMKCGGNQRHIQVTWYIQLHVNSSVIGKAVTPDKRDRIYETVSLALFACRAVSIIRQYSTFNKLYFEKIMQQLLASIPMFIKQI